jgi:hypothetical protein
MWSQLRDSLAPNAVSRQERTEEGDHTQQAVDDGRWMDPGRRQARGGEIEHVAQRRQELPGELRQWRLADRRHRPGPDLHLEGRGSSVGGAHFRRIRDGAVERETGVDVLSEAFLQGLPRLGRQEIEPMIGVADGIGLLDDQLAPRVEAGRRPSSRRMTIPMKSPAANSVPAATSLMGGLRGRTDGWPSPRSPR